MLDRVRQLIQTSSLGRWFRSSGLFSWTEHEIAGDDLGRRGEKLAAKFLRQQGYKIVSHSHRQRLGEIDLIALDQGVVVFVEVKSWRSDRSGDPSEAVTPSKQEKLTRAALIYLKQKKLLDHPARFDVISIVLNAETSPQIRHFKSAFEAVGRGQMYR